MNNGALGFPQPHAQVTAGIIDCAEVTQPQNDNDFDDIKWGAADVDLGSTGWTYSPTTGIFTAPAPCLAVVATYIFWSNMTAGQRQVEIECGADSYMRFGPVAVDATDLDTWDVWRAQVCFVESEIKVRAAQEGSGGNYDVHARMYIRPLTF